MQRETLSLINERKEMSNAYGMEQLPPDLVEDILERLCTKSLVRFTSVSKQWNSMIKSTSFASRHQIRAQTPNPEILLVTLYESHRSESYSYLRTLELQHSVLPKIDIISKPRRCRLAITGSCGGLVCVYDFQKEMYLINPATRWSRSLPRAKYQQINRIRQNLDSNSTRNCLGFGKDAVTGKYKMVWLYNSKELDLVGQTTCEVFEFTTNTWRSVIGSPHRICSDSKSRSVYSDGSLHWFTVQFHGITKIIHFDLHTEVFQVMSKIPVALAYPDSIIMCSLNNRLCVSERRSNSQEIWSLNPHKGWEKTYIMNLSFTCRGDFGVPMIPITIFDETELLFHYPSSKMPSSILRQDTRIGNTTFIRDSALDQAISYIPSLISI